MNAKRVLRVMVWGWLPVVCLVMWSGRADAAQTVHLTLEIDGSQVRCDSTILSLERENTIEGLAFGHTVFVPVDPATGQATARPTHRPIVLRKRIDRCSPLLMQALAQNQPTTGMFRFYRPDPSGEGAEEHFYTVTIGGARVVGMSTVSPDVTDPATASLPPTDEVSFVYTVITFTYEPNGATTTINLEEPR
jgi:type VI secretion system secreted protein Hcp